jgi:peptide/nickel transport system ATP-binding protein
MSLLAIEALSVRYGAHDVLRDVSLAVAAGEIVALVGPSGSGKSTLAHAVIGLLPDDARSGGVIRLDNADLATLDDRGWAAVRGAQIAMVFQDPAAALNPALSIGRQIDEVFARHTLLARAARADAVGALLARVGLDLAPGRYPHSLSGGQRQRVAIAIALAAGPRLLIADEPTAALDPITQAGIVELLVGEARARQMGLLLVSHDLALVAAVADRLVVLDQGRVAEAGPTAALLAAPASPFLRRAVAAGRPADPAPVPAEAETLVGIAGVSRHYAGGGLFARETVPALRDVTTAIRRGETLAVVGASGSGKSTLARLVLGLDRPDAGVVTVGGETWHSLRGAALRAQRRRVQAVFQDPAASFDPRWTVERIVAEPLGLLDRVLAPAERVARVVEALGHVGLDPDAASRLPGQFSGGQRQRIALARALILRPDLVVLDEALTALDPPLRADMVGLLRRLQHEFGLAYLFVSHDLALVRGLAHRVLVLRDGVAVEQGPVDQVLDAPRDPYTAALIAASPAL